MILCLDLGNTHLFGGVFKENQLLCTFRYNTRRATCTEDELGVFLKNVLAQYEINPNEISHVALCSVVPQGDSLIQSMCRQYFKADFFNLQAGVKTGLKVLTENPKEVGADRVANAIAAVNRYPNQNLIIIDLGTATTFCAVSQRREYLGGVIIAGVRLSMEGLFQYAAKLPSVDIIPKQKVLGRTTIDSIQSGLYFGHLSILQTLSQQITQEVFPAGPAPLLIGTGGFMNLFKDQEIFRHMDPNLVLEGLHQAFLLNYKR